MTVTHMSQTPKQEKYADVEISGSRRRVWEGDELPEGVVADMTSAKGLFIQPAQGEGYWTQGTQIKGTRNEARTQAAERATVDAKDLGVSADWFARVSEPSVFDSSSAEYLADPFVSFDLAVEALAKENDLPVAVIDAIVAGPDNQTEEQALLLEDHYIGVDEEDAIRADFARRVGGT